MENVGNVISSVSSEDEEGEEDEESSSSPEGLEDQLSSFRQQWEAELSLKGANESRGEKKNSRRRNRSSSSLGDGATSAEDKAYCLFMQGVDAERSGHMFEAIKFYRQAVQLVPDIESKIQSISGFDDYSSEVSEESGDDADEGDREVEDVTSQLQALTLSSIRYTCQRQFLQKSKHISCLPIELLILVFRWVVASHLDLRSLENLSTVCRGFYACARDQEIWRLVCQRIWGNGAFLTKDYPSWRQMYLERPHLRFDGIYICRMTYVRQGEQSYIDASYNTWFLVEYYRFIRVFPDGSIIMLTSPEEPKEVVKRMRLKSATGEGMVKGNYRLNGDTLSAVLQREPEKQSPYQRYKRKNDRNNNPSIIKGQIFRMEMKVSGTGQSNNTKLEWQHYSCETSYTSSNVPSVSEFDLSTYRPLVFSRVKSYTRTAVCSL